MENYLVADGMELKPKCDEIGEELVMVQSTNNNNCEDHKIKNINMEDYIDLTGSSSHKSNEENQETDVNLLFDEILHTEELTVQKSYEEGFQDGLRHGNIDGYEVGYNQGVAIGQEFGDIYGFVVAQQKVKQTPRVERSLCKLREAIELFPDFNDLDQDLFTLIYHIRGLYKHIQASLETKKVELNNVKKKDFSF